MQIKIPESKQNSSNAAPSLTRSEACSGLSRPRLHRTRDAKSESRKPDSKRFRLLSREAGRPGVQLSASSDAESCLLATSIDTCLPPYLPTFVPSYLPTFLPSYLLTFLPSYLLPIYHIYQMSAFLPACLAACLPACLPARLSAFLHTYTYLPTHAWLRGGPDSFNSRRPCPRTRKGAPRLRARALHRPFDLLPFSALRAGLCLGAPAPAPAMPKAARAHRGSAAPPEIWPSEPEPVDAVEPRASRAERHVCARQSDGRVRHFRLAQLLGALHV